MWVKYVGQDPQNTRENPQRVIYVGQDPQNIHEKSTKQLTHLRMTHYNAQNLNCSFVSSKKVQGLDIS